MLTHLRETVFRAKGFIHTSEQPRRRLVFQFVGRRETLSAGAPWGSEETQSRLAFIAHYGTVNVPALQKALSA